MNSNIKSLICGLFDVQADEYGVQRVITPMEYIGTKDKVVIRIRPLGHGRFKIDENGDAMFYASMAGADVESDTIQNWLTDLPSNFPIFSEDEVLVAETENQSDIASLVIKVAQIAQDLYALATARTRAPRSTEEFKKNVRKAVYAAALLRDVRVDSDVELDEISGNFVADHVIYSGNSKLVIIAATGVQRLLEAELMHSTFERDHISAKVIAAVESQESVGKRQFERAGYYTDKTVTFSQSDFAGLIGRSIN